MTKRTIITALAGLNIFLLAALVMSTYSLPRAYAQRRGASTNFVAVTCQADSDYDALYVLDLAKRTLHCFIPTRDRSGNVQYGGNRDLSQDFSR